MEIRKLFAKNVRQLREAQGWSQEVLAEHAGLHRTYVSGIERGVRNPTLTVVARVAAALKVKPEDLLAERRKD